MHIFSILNFHTEELQNENNEKACSLLLAEKALRWNAAKKH